MTGSYFNRKWKSHGRTLEIQVRQFEDEAGNWHQGLVGTMDGEVQQFTMNEYRADLKTYQDIEYYLEAHASGGWGKSLAEIQAERNA